MRMPAVTHYDSGIVAVSVAIAIVASIVTGRPVKWVEDRMENLMATAFARDYWMKGKI